MTIRIPFQNACSTLPKQCFEHVLPTPVPHPQLIRFNTTLANELGIATDGASPEALARVFSGNQVLENANPMALAYSGHQFGHLNPHLGDGRAILLGDVIDKQGNRRDIQLKGSGRTPFSRQGDGRSPLGPALREYLFCEAMHALGVPTTRALAVVSSGERVIRQQLEPGAIFTRVAASHLRVGTLEYFSLRRDETTLHFLADHVLKRHYPFIQDHTETRYLNLFQAICQRQAHLIAQWMLLGFIHGVMNTDNMTLCGETIDYGPCAFMDTYKANQVFSAIDEQGRYAYQNQPAIGQWNLARLAEAMLPLFPGDTKNAVKDATEILSQYTYEFQKVWEQGFNTKLGFSEREDGDAERAKKLLSLMEQSGVDYTCFFRRLSHILPNVRPHDHPYNADQHSDHGNTSLWSTLLPSSTTPHVKQALYEWLNTWIQQLHDRELDFTVVSQRMQSVNPAIIPRNHRVAQAIRAAEANDFTVFERLMEALKDPYIEYDTFEEYQRGPEPHEQVHRTFCGT